MRKLFAVLSLLIVASMLLAACGAPAAPQTVVQTQIVEVTPTAAAPADFKSKDPTTLVNVVFGEPETLDPALDYETSGGEIIANVYDTLITYDREKPTTFVPMLAMEVPSVANGGISADGKSVTFKIRTGIKFHDGADLTPSDVAYTFQRGVLQGGTGSPQWLMTEPFFGIGVDDMAAVVGDKLSANADEKAAALAGAADLAAFDATAFGTLFTDLVTYYNGLSGFAVDAAATLAVEENVTAVNDMIAGLATAADDAAKKDAIKTAALDMLFAAEGGDAYALYDDAAGMAKIDPALAKEIGEMAMAAVVADDAAGTVTFNLAQAWGPFLPTIANFWGGIMDKDWTIANGGWDGDPANWHKYYGVTSESNPFNEKMNGTGPFMFDHWTKGQELVLVRNPNYWVTEPLFPGGKTGPAALERIVIKKVDEWGTRFAMLQAGDADFASVNRTDIAQVDPMVGELCMYNLDKNDYDACVSSSDQPFRLFKGSPSVSRTDAFMTFKISTSEESPNPLLGSGKLDGNGIPADFFSDAHIRRAFNYCFDWDLYIQDALAGEAFQSIGVGLPGMPGYESDGPHYSFDADKCAAEFKAADLDKDGIAAGDDPEGDVWTTGFRMQVAYNTGNTVRQTVAEILAGNIATVNDKFQIEIVGMPWPTFLRNQRAKNLPVFFSGWIEDIHDPHNWYQPYVLGTYGSRQNLPADAKAELKELINAGVAEPDPAKRDVIYKELNQKIFDLAPQIIMAVATGRHYEQRWVEGFYSNPITPGFNYYQLSKK